MEIKFKPFSSKDLIYKNGNSIPDKSGLYAWYLDFSKLGIVKNKDDFSSIIIKLQNLLVSEKLNGTVKSPLKKYEVNVFQNKDFLNDYIIENDELEGKKISELTDEECLEVSKILGNFSLLVNPLYIGVASSLRSRYRAHKNSFERVKRLIDEDEDSQLIKDEAKKSFGGRIAYQGFTWDLLVFSCLDTELESSLNKSTEYLLNRLYSPIFGRR